VVILLPETDPPALIPEMVSRCREVEGLVQGVDVRGPLGGPLRQWLRRRYHTFMRENLHTELLPGSTDFRVLSRRLVSALIQVRSSRWQLRQLASVIGGPRAVFPYTPLIRSGVETSRSFGQEVHEAIETVIAHSRQPLRYVSWLGLAASGLNALYALYALGIYAFKKDVAPGWTTTALQHASMFFLLFLTLAILSEYIGRLLDEAKGRPPGFIFEEKNSPVLILEQRRNVVVESK
jgi:polyisoprenyl-phosphate glycosyltransferase